MKVFGLNVKTVPDTEQSICIANCVLVEFCDVHLRGNSKVPPICDNDNYHYELED